MRIVKQNRFKNLGELHKEWTEAGVKTSRAPHTDVSRNLATVVFRGVLPGQRRRTGLLPSGPKSSFQMRASFVFHLETKVLESGGRVEKLIAQVAWRPVLRFHSLWWFGVQCHLLVLVHCVFLKTNVTAPVYQEILEHFMLPSDDQLFKDADFIFQQGFAPAHTAKRTKSWLNDHGVTVLDWPANSPDLNPTEIQDTTMQMTWRPLSKQPGLHYTWAVPQTDHLHATPHWCSNSCKRKPNQVLSA